MATENEDWGVRGVDGDGDSNRRKGSIKNASESEEKGEGWGEILTTLPGVMTRARARDLPGNVPTPLPKTVPRGQ